MPLLSAKNRKLKPQFTQAHQIWTGKKNHLMSNESQADDAQLSTNRLHSAIYSAVCGQQECIQSPRPAPSRYFRQQPGPVKISICPCSSKTPCCHEVCDEVDSGSLRSSAPYSPLTMQSRTSHTGMTSSESWIVSQVI